MKYAEFDINSNKIEFLNSVLGFETILINGKKISGKFSVTGIEHKFDLNSKNYTLKSKAKLFSKESINIQLHENGKIIDTLNVPYDKRHKMYWMSFGIFVGLIGFKLGKMLVLDLSH